MKDEERDSGEWEYKIRSILLNAEQFCEYIKAMIVGELGTNHYHYVLLTVSNVIHPSPSAPFVRSFSSRLAR